VFLLLLGNCFHARRTRAVRTGIGIGERGAEKGCSALLTLRRAGDFRRKDAGAAGFKHSSVARENDPQLRFGKHILTEEFP
jgi:hypothetical protein